MGQSTIPRIAWKLIEQIDFSLNIILLPVSPSFNNFHYKIIDILKAIGDYIICLLYIVIDISYKNMLMWYYRSWISPDWDKERVDTMQSFPSNHTLMQYKKCHMAHHNMCPLY